MDEVRPVFFGPVLSFVLDRPICGCMGDDQPAQVRVERVPAAGGAMIAQYRLQQRNDARDTTLVAGLLALVALPAWALFDFVELPDRAGSFLVVRLISEVAIALMCIALGRTRLGARWPEQLSVVTVAIPAIAIAWMIPRSGTQLEAYALGLSLPVYATAFLLSWRWRMTVVLVACTVVAIAGSAIGLRPALDGRQITTITFYLATAMALTIAAQVYRDRKSWQQHVTQTALEAERHRNQILVEELDQLTREDPLTAVGNRRAWEERLTREVLQSRRSARPVCVIVCDFDRFKAVNDDHGHDVGDAVLRFAAALLVERVRASDFVARLGGDEFAILCPDTSLAAAAQLASELGARTRTAEFPAGLSMTCSIGVAELERSDLTTGHLYHRADCALYDAKIARDTHRCAEPGKPAHHR